MVELKRVQGKFTWVPKSKRYLYMKNPDHRVAVFFLARGVFEDAPSLRRSLYFVNNSKEELTKITTVSGGYQTFDDEAATVSGPVYCYEKVKPGEAVKVEEYDLQYDSDYMLGISVTVESEKIGSQTFTAMPQKGGIKLDTPLLYDTGERA